MSKHKAKIVSAPYPPDNLPDIVNNIWQELQTGAAQRQHAFHTAMLCNIDANGQPTGRVVVLRGADSTTRQVWFHTDARGPKVAALKNNPAACFVFYDAAAGLQIRASGTASIHQTDNIADEAWHKTRIFSRRCYLITAPPGTVSAKADSGLPPELQGSKPELSAHEQGREHFCVIRLTLQHLDWLLLDARGHIRADFSWQHNDWQGRWLIP